MYLRCSVPQCGAQLDLHDRALACPRCGDLLEVVVDKVPLDPPALKRQWRERRLSFDPRDVSGVWRFRDFLPEYPADTVITLGEGNTPLVRGSRTARFAGLRTLWFKHLGWNPTSSFKDLGMTVGMTRTDRIRKVALGLLIAAPVVIVIAMLFSGADAVFGKTVSEIFNFKNAAINIYRIVRDILVAIFFVASGWTIYTRISESRKAKVGLSANAGTRLRPSIGTIGLPWNWVGYFAPPTSTHVAIISTK